MRSSILYPSATPRFSALTMPAPQLRTDQAIQRVGQLLRLQRRDHRTSAVQFPHQQGHHRSV